MSTRTLRRIAFAVPLALALAVLTGCMKSEEATKVGSDGKGRSTLTIVLDLAKLEGLKEMMEGMGMGGGQQQQSDPREDLKPEEFKKRFEGAEGVKVISVDHKQDDEKKTVTLTAVLEFDSLEALYKSGAVEAVDVKLEKLEGGNYKFTRKMGAGMAPDTSDPESAAMMEAMLGMFQPFLEGMEMAFEITLPTAIVETSGEIIGVNKVRWSLGFKDLMDAKKREQTVVFGGEGIAWKPFAITAAEIEAAKEKREAAVVTPSEKDEDPAKPEEGAPEDKQPVEEGTR